MEPVVHLRAAVSLLGRFPALAGVDLDVQPGEILLVQGPNGAGKTTLLRTCAGLLPVVSGEATVLGFDLQHRADRRAVRRHVGLLGHATGLYEDLTVADNVRFWAKASGAAARAAGPPAPPPRGGAPPPPRPPPWGGGSPPACPRASAAARPSPRWS